MVRKIIIFTLLAFSTVAIHAQLSEAQEKYNQAATAVNEGNTKQAIDLFNEAIELLGEVEEDETAEELLYNAEGFLPGLYLKMAKETAEAGNIDEAIEQFKKTLEIAGTYGDNSAKSNAEKALPRLYYKKAAEFYKEARYDEALVELDNAIALDNQYSSAYYLKTVVYKKLDNDEMFAEMAKQTIANSGNDNKTKARTQKLATSHFLKKGNDAKEAQNYQEAIVNISKSLEFEPDNSTAVLLLMQSYIAIEDWDNTIATAEKALSIETDEEKKAGIYYNMASAYVGKGDNDNACEAYKKASYGNYEANAQYQIQHVLKCQ